MKIIIVDSDSIVLDEWDSSDELDLGIFALLADSDDVPDATRKLLVKELNQKFEENESPSATPG